MQRALKCSSAVLVVSLALAACSSGSSAKRAPAATRKLWQHDSRRAICCLAQTPPSGTNGLAFDGSNLWVADYAGSQILRVDPSGRILARYGQADGVALSDDLAIGPDHSVYWSGLGGIVGRVAPDGKVTTVATLGPGVNPITFTRDRRRLYAGRTLEGQGLYEVDPAGKRPPRLVNATWDTNAFAFGPDGLLYGPKKRSDGEGAVEQIDVKTGVIKEVKVGFNYSVAVKFDAKGRCNVLSTAPAALQRLDLKTGAITEVAKPLTPIVDNFAFDGHGRIFISSFSQPVLTVVAADGTTSMLHIGS
jgi:sugar lactone lactonase YvrE